MYSCINETGRRLWKLRKEKDYTQKEVARLIGVNETSYKSWENGEIIKSTVRGKDGKMHRVNTLDRRPVNIGSAYIVKLADLYGVSCDYILGRTEYRTVNGADVAKITGLSDHAISVLQWYGSVDDSMMYPIARDVSRLLVDWDKNGENSLLHAVKKYAQCLPGSRAQVIPSGDGLNALNVADIDMSAALLMGLAAAAGKYRADFLQELNAARAD